MVLFFYAQSIGESQSVSFKTYKNPVIPGDHPDCTVTKIGNDYYTTGSSFNLEPQIYHSTDLVHWRVISKPVTASWEGFGDSPGGGCWGGQMVFYGGKYWHYFSRGHVMYFTTASAPEGPWSTPVRVKDPSQLPFTLGYDNSIFIDDNNKWYLVVKNGQPNNAIVELGNDGQPTGVVYNLNWLNPAPDYPYSWAEGPVMWKYNGYYYYSFARDLAGGQKVMRSRSLTDNKDSWEMLGDFFNENDPLKPGSLFTGPNHSSAVVEASDGTFWVVHPLYAKDEWRGQGRQGLLNQVFYDNRAKPTAVYPINSSFTAPNLPSNGIPWMVPKSDFFENDVLNPEWQFYGYTPSNLYSLTEKPGWLRLTSKSNNRFNFVSKNDAEHNYSLITHVNFNPLSVNSEAGLLIMRGDEKQYVKLVITKNDLGRRILRFSYKNVEYQVDNSQDEYRWLKLVRINHKITAYCSSDGINWNQIGNAFDILEIDSYSDFSTFTGTRQGLFVQAGTAYFDLYVYRDAYTSILAECPANEYGTRPTSKSDGISVLDSIHHNDWALYAGVEFGSSTYSLASDSVEFIASSATAGGMIEIWLDSIDTGTKMATCDIDNTGDWNNYKSFKFKTSRVKGRHDVYLKFVGNYNQRLFKIKSFRFIPVVAPMVVKAYTNFTGDRVMVHLSKPILNTDSIYGFSLTANQIYVDIEKIQIDSISDYKIIIQLKSPLDSTMHISLSYANGNVFSTDSMALNSFTDFFVFNNTYGSSPTVLKLISDPDGSKINIYFSKGVILSHQQALKFILNKNMDVTENAVSGNYLNNDSSIITLSYSFPWYYEDTLWITYPDSDIMGVNGGRMKEIERVLVTNISKGRPLQILNTQIIKSTTSYSTIVVKFDKKIINDSNQEKYFSLKINNKNAYVRKIFASIDTLFLEFSPSAKIGDTLYLSYANGQIQSIYGGELKEFSDLPIPLIAQTLDNNSLNNELIQIFPNPAHGSFTVCTKYPHHTLNIYTIDGKLVNTIFIGNTQKSYVTLNKSSGLYVIQAIGENFNVKTKLLVQ